MVDRGYGKETPGVKLLKGVVWHWPCHPLLENHAGGSALQAKTLMFQASQAKN